MSTCKVGRVGKRVSRVCSASVRNWPGISSPSAALPWRPHGPGRWAGYSGASSPAGDVRQFRLPAPHHCPDESGWSGRYGAGYGQRWRYLLPHPVCVAEDQWHAWTGEFPAGSERERVLTTRKAPLVFLEPCLLCLAHLSVQGHFPIGITLAVAHNHFALARRKKEVVEMQSGAFADAQTGV